MKSLNFKCPILGLTSKLLLEKDEEEETVKDEIQKYSKELTVSKPATSEKTKTENNNPGTVWKLRVVRTQAISFLKTMSEGVGSDIQQL